MGVTATFRSVGEEQLERARKDPFYEDDEGPQAMELAPGLIGESADWLRGVRFAYVYDETDEDGSSSRTSRSSAPSSSRPPSGARARCSISPERATRGSDSP